MKSSKPDSLRARSEEILGPSSLDELAGMFFRGPYYDEILKIATAYPDKKSVLIDFQKLDKYSSELADALLAEPSKILQLMEDLLNSKEEDSKEEDSKEEDGSDSIDLPIEGDYKINVRVFNLPKTQTHNIAAFLRHNYTNQLVQTEGIIKRVESPRPLIEEIVYECPTCNAQIKVPQLDIRKLAQPAAKKCPRCDEKLNMKTPAPTTSVQWITLQEPLEVTSGMINIPILFKDDLVDDVEPDKRKLIVGNQLKVVGVLVQRLLPKAKTPLPQPYLEGLYWEPSSKDYEYLDLTSDDILKIEKLSKGKDILKKLVGSIAPSILGLDDEKLALALQLFGGQYHTYRDGTSRRGNLHILMIGNPAVAKSKLGGYAVSASPKGLITSGAHASGVGMTVSMSRDETTGAWSIDAGALVLANKGLLFIDEFDKTTREDMHYLNQAMEDQFITPAKAGIVGNIPARTAILASANPKYGRFDEYDENLLDQFNIPVDILSRFDFIFIVRSPPNVRDVITHMVESAYSETKKGGTPTIPQAVLKKYVAYARRVHINRIEKSAKDFLIDFTEDTINKSKEKGVMPLTYRAVDSIRRTSEAFARIHLRSVVKKEDVEQAAKIYLNMLKTLSVGFGEAEGTLDYATIQYGTTSNKLNRHKDVDRTIHELCKGGKQVSLEEIVAELSNHMTDLEATEIIEKMKQKGELWEPKTGYISIVQ